MKIAIVKLSALGDIIHTMLVLQFIKQQQPDIVIDWIVERAFKGILEHNIHINQIHCINLKQAKKTKSIKLFLSEISRIKQFGQYDLVIEAQGLLKSAIVAKMLGAKKIIGFDKNSIREKIASWFYNEKVNIGYDKNIIIRNIALINTALKLNITKEIVLQKMPFLFCNHSSHFDCLSKTQKNILLVIGASFECKKYPIKHYAKFANVIGENCLILWGNDDEKNQAQQLIKLAPNAKLAPKLSLDVLKSLIFQVDLIIGGDTGPTYMAWALNKPSIILFGATPGYRNAYQTDINIIIESDSKVNPYKIDQNDLSINNINPKTIIEQIQCLSLYNDTNL